MITIPSVNISVSGMDGCVMKSPISGFGLFSDSLALLILCLTVSITSPGLECG